MGTFEIVDSLDHQNWYQFVCNHPKGSVFQTPQMWEVFTRTYHQRPFFRAAINSKGEILALLSAVYVQTLPNPLGSLSSRSLLYAEPLCTDTAEGEKALTALIAEHDSEMRQTVLFTEVRPLYAPGRERAALEARGYAYEDYLNFLIDLRRPKQELLAAMSNGCRAIIRRGERQGIHVEEMNTPQGVDLLYRFLVAGYERARVPLADKSLFVHALEALNRFDMIKIFVGYLNDQPVGASVVLLFKGRVYEWYWAAERIKSVYPAECITWHRIAWGQEHGFALYDFGGAGWPNKPYGVRDFKAKFGPQLVQYGRYRKVYSRLRFSLAEHGYEFVRNAINPRRWGLSG
jgi:serine/alanine adding enzyme